MQISGIDADYIIESLMALEQRPLAALTTRKSAAQAAADAIAKLRTQVDAFRLTAAKLADVTSFGRFAASVSDADAVSAAVTGTATRGSLAFTVDQLAAAHGLRSIGTVASSSVAVTSDAVIAVAAGTRALGIESVRAGAGLAAGAISMSVVQSSAGATSTGTAPVVSTTVIGPGNDILDLTVDGSSRTVTIAAGTYDPTGLAAAVQAGLDAAGGGVAVTVDGGGAIAMTTTREGSAATLQVTGGTALGDLALAVDAVARSGTDGVIDVGGVQTAVTMAEPGAAVSVDTGAAMLTVTLAGGVRVGDVAVEVVSTGDRSLASVAAAITSAGAGVDAAAVRVADGAWRLQLSATSTGVGGHIAVDGAVFDLIGGVIESSSARDARITIGSGPGAYQVEAAGNTFTDVLPGVTITARQVSASPVTVAVERDDAALAKQVADVVSAANTLLAEIKVQTRYDTTNHVGGPLVGNATVRALADQVREALGGRVTGVATALPSDVGIEVQRDGSFTFDQSRLLAALDDDPDAVAQLFGRGGTGTGSVAFAGASADTVPGTYDVVVTTAATRADSGVLFAGGAAASARVGVRIGDVTALVDVTAGQSAAQIADALNAALAGAGLDVVAELDGTGVRIRAEQWGSSGGFELNADVLGAGSWIAHAGTDVAGTIDGEPAIGSGRRLTLGPTASGPAAGLAVDIAGGVTGAVGTLEYVPGVAGRIVQVATELTRVDSGQLSTAADAAGRRIQRFNEQIDRLEDRLVVREANLRRQWSSLQTLLGGLQSQGDWLSGQLATLPKGLGG